MNRNAIVALALGATLLLTAGAAQALNLINCQGGPCVGTSKDDTIRGTEGADQISAGPGDDGVASFGGDDTVKGGKGNDNIGDGGLGDDDTDKLFGGRGNDRIDVQDGDNKDFVDCGPGDKDVVFADNEANQSLLNCEEINR